MKYITTEDLANGFARLEMTEEERQKIDADLDQAARQVVSMLDQAREGRIPCPRRVVMWQRKRWGDLADVHETAVLVKRTDGGQDFCAQLDDWTPYFLEIRDGNAPIPGEGELGQLLQRLDLDGETMADRLDAEPVLYGEAPTDVIVVAELSLEANAWTMTRVRP